MILIPLAACAVLFGLFLPIDSHAQDQPADTAEVDKLPVGPLPPSNVRARDARNDHGHALLVQWNTSPDDGAGKNNVMLYRIERTPRFEGPFDPVEQPPGGQYRLFHSAVYNEAVWRLVPHVWDTVGEVPAGTTEYEDRGGKLRDVNDFLPDHVEFQYRV
ncbi:MAG: hypothetical protein GF341_10755, partial [candidate division Zixibacteria bacterium]|nr:hypothetical protein [candidate division Zixibacteria bacterium]